MSEVVGWVNPVHDSRWYGYEPVAGAVASCAAAKVVPHRSGLPLYRSALSAIFGGDGGAVLWCARGSGEIVPYGDPVDAYWCSRIVWMWSVDATDLLQGFARWCANRVYHLWEGSLAVDLYLEYGGEWKDRRAALRSAENAYAKADACANSARDYAVLSAMAACGDPGDRGRHVARNASLAAGAAVAAVELGAVPICVEPPEPLDRRTERLIAARAHAAWQERAAQEEKLDWLLLEANRRESTSPP